eukprot:4201907-Amphidinium_carterae.1
MGGGKKTNLRIPHRGAGGSASTEVAGLPWRRGSVSGRKARAQDQEQLWTWHKREAWSDARTWLHAPPRARWCWDRDTSI